jgi:hypothetical protein
LAGWSWRCRGAAFPAEDLQKLPLLKDRPFVSAAEFEERLDAHAVTGALRPAGCTA